jgi:hypothetical protein
MRRLTAWFKRLFVRSKREIGDESLPFTAEEFARLLSSGRPEDMKLLANRLSQDALPDMRSVSAVAPAHRH